MQHWDVDAPVSTDERLLKQLHTEIFLDHKKEVKIILDTNWANLNPVGRINPATQYSCRMLLTKYCTSRRSTNVTSFFRTSWAR